MIKRTFSTLVLWAAVTGSLFFLGTLGGLLLITLLAVVSQYELYRLMQKAGYAAMPWLGCAAGTALLLLPYLLDRGGAGFAVGFTAGDFLVLGIIVAALGSLREPEERRMQSFAGTVFGLAYIPYLLSYFIAVVLLPGETASGLILAVWVVVVVKFTDVGAYLVGSLCGRHKLAPQLSPGKTWEGAIGGVLISALLGALFVALFRDHFPAGIGPLQGALLALPLAILSIPSDLLESVFKRQAKAKDSGKAIPGIGGAYDLSDSLILTAPLAYWLLSIFS